MKPHSKYCVQACILHPLKFMKHFHTVVHIMYTGTRGGKGREGMSLKKYVHLTLPVKQNDLFCFLHTHFTISNI